MVRAALAARSVSILLSHRTASMSTSQLDAPAVLITGAAGGGIGTATALKFARKGYRVAVTDIVDLSPVKASVAGAGAECVAAPMDVTSSESVDRAVRSVFEQFGRVRA